MSKEPAQKTYVLFKVDTRGPDLAAAAGKVLKSLDITLVNRGDTALVVKGRPAEVKKLAQGLDGWRAEANTVVR